jgi:hypothetical protein
MQGECAGAEHVATRKVHGVGPGVCSRPPATDNARRQIVCPRPGLRQVWNVDEMREVLHDSALVISGIRELAVYPVGSISAVQLLHPLAGQLPVVETADLQGWVSRFAAIGVFAFGVLAFGGSRFARASASFRAHCVPIQHAKRLSYMPNIKCEKY